MARRRSARRARNATQHMYKIQNKQLVKTCFLGFQHHTANMKLSCKLLAVSSDEQQRVPAMDAAFLTQIMALWRIGTQISTMDCGEENGFAEGDEEPNPALAGLSIAPKDGNSVFIRRQLMLGWRKIVFRRKARQRFLAT